MGHMYVDVLTTQTASIVEDIIKGAYERRALEGVLENDKKIEIATERDRRRFLFIVELNANMDA